MGMSSDLIENIRVIMSSRSRFAGVVKQLNDRTIDSCINVLAEAKSQRAVMAVEQKKVELLRAEALKKVEAELAAVGLKMDSVIDMHTSKTAGIPRPKSTVSQQKYFIVDVDGNNQFWSGSGYPPVSFKESGYKTGTGPKGKDKYLAKNLYQHKKAFSEQVRSHKRVMNKDQLQSELTAAGIDKMNPAGVKALLKKLKL